MILSSFGNNAKPSKKFEELTQKWIKGEISSEEELEELIKYHKK